MTVGEIFIFLFLESRIGFYTSVLEKNYVQGISRVYNINNGSYVQVVSKRSFMKINLQKWLKLLEEIKVDGKGRKLHRKRKSMVSYKRIWNLVVKEIVIAMMQKLIRNIYIE